MTTYAYAILYRCGARSGFFQGMSGIGPMLGGTKKDAVRFQTKTEAFSEMNRWPLVASACAEVVQIEEEAARGKAAASSCHFCSRPLSLAALRAKARVCSACRARGLKRDRDEGNLRRKTHEIACAACGKMFRGVVLGRRKYCSRKCQPNYSRRYKR